MGVEKSVSVLLVTYNHENYIEQAFISILKQLDNVLKEIVVAEDCSNDRTREIIDRYKQQYPELIKPIYRNRNVGLLKNFTEGLRVCDGKYISVLSGDDYWTDLEKLSYQSGFLEKNPEYVLISNNAIEFIEDTQQWLIQQSNAKSENRELFDFFISNDIYASQTMFRNLRSWQFPSFYYNNRGEDRQLWMMLSREGKIMNDLSKITGVYRRHHESITMSNKQTKIEGYLIRLENNLLWAEYFGVLNNDNIKHAQSLYRLKLVKEYLKKYKIKEALGEIRLIDNDEVFYNQSFILKALSIFK